MELVKKTMKIYPYEPGGYGTSIATGLDGKVPLLRSPDGKLDWAFLRPQPPAKFVEGSGKVMNTIPPSDYSYFEMMNEVVQREPADSLGPRNPGFASGRRHREGQAVQPRCQDEKDSDRRCGDRLCHGTDLKLARARLRRFRLLSWFCVDQHALRGRLPIETPPPQVSSTGVITPYPPTGARTLDSRTAMFYYATGITPAMCMRLTEIGSQYLGAFTDSKGEYLDGSKTYKITLPANIPAAKFWSFTVYDNQTRSMLDTPQRFPRAGSQSYPTPAAVANPDGSTMVYFGPTKPAGVKDGNWIQTVPGKGWNTLLRFYSRLEPFFSKTWRPGEFELVK